MFRCSKQEQKKKIKNGIQIFDIPHDKRAVWCPAISGVFIMGDQTFKPVAQKKGGLDADIVCDLLANLGHCVHPLLDCWCWVCPEEVNQQLQA